MVTIKRYMDAQMFLFNFLIVVCTFVCAIEMQVEIQKKREKCAKIQDLMSKLQGDYLSRLMGFRV